jgi:cytochrome c-type biogenesis protein CcmH/NrfG
MDEKSFFGWRGLGFTLGHQKRWADCTAALEKARALKPTDTDVLMALGDIYMLELEDLEKALKAYEEYVQAGGDDPAVPEIIEEIKKALGK